MQRRSWPRRWATRLRSFAFDDENLTVGEYLDRWLEHTAMLGFGDVADGLTLREHFATLERNP